MLRVSRLTDYATQVANVLALDWQVPQSASGIAEQTGLPTPTVSKILKMLAQGSLLTSTRGVGGGYALSRDPKQISLAEVISAIEGPMAITECNVHDGVCDKESSCQLKGNWQKINQLILSVLGEVSLHDMAGSLPQEIKFSQNLDLDGISVRCGDK